MTLNASDSSNLEQLVLKGLKVVFVPRVILNLRVQILMLIVLSDSVQLRKLKY